MGKATNPTMLLSRNSMPVTGSVFYCIMGLIGPWQNHAVPYGTNYSTAGGPMFGYPYYRTWVGKLLSLQLRCIRLVVAWQSLAMFYGTCSFSAAGGPVFFYRCFEAEVANLLPSSLLKLQFVPCLWLAESCNAFIEVVSLQVEGHSMATPRIGQNADECHEKALDRASLFWKCSW